MRTEQRRPPRPPEPDEEPRHEAAGGGRLSRGYARAVVFLRYLVPLAWIAAAGAVYVVGPTISQLPTASVGALLPSHLPALTAEQQSARIFGTSLLPRIAVVERDPNGLSLAQQRRVVEYAIRVDRGREPGYPQGTIAAPYPNTLKVFPAARERSTAVITYLAFPSSVSTPQQRLLADRYAQAVGLPGAPAYVTGFIVGNLVQSEAINSHLHWVELGSLALVALIIGIYLRSLLAPVVTLITAGIVWILSTRAVAYLALRTGVTLHQEVEPVIAVLLLGVVTDYSVFFLAGGRMRLDTGDGKRAAARWTTTRYIPIILTAATLVALGLSTLRVASIGFVQALGPAMAIVVVTSMAVAVTLIPASIALLGRALYWPGADHREFEFGRRIRAWVIRRLTGRLTAAFASTVIVLGLLALGWGIHRTQLALTPISALGSGTAPEQGAHAAEAGFAGGIVSPTEVVLRRPGITNDGARLTALSLRMGRVDGVAAAVGAGDASVVGLRRVFRAPGADAVRYLVVLDHGPYGAPAIDDLQNLQRRLPHLLASVGLGGAKISYAGDTAIAEQTVQRIRHDIEWVAIAAFAVNFVLLALFLRALVAPFLLILASALALAATFGITTWFFQSFLGYAQLTYYVPLAVGVLLLSFGSDYNLFVVGRIWQESRFESVEQAIRSVAPRTSRAVSVAGLALAGSFAALAIVPLKPFYEFAFAMSVGVLIDTFVVRSYLIPAMLALFGRGVWWPSRRGG